MVYRAAVFDMDGVIVDSEPAHREITFRLAERLGFTMNVEEYDGLAGRNTLETFAVLKERYGFKAPVSDIPAEYERMYLERLRAGSGGDLIPGVRPLIESLSLIGIPLAVASSAPMKCIMLILDGFGLTPYFNAVVSGDKLARPKPAPDIYLEAADRLGVLPEYCAAVEDSEIGVASAKGAGMYCVGFRNPSSGRQDLSRADCVLDSFTGGELLQLFKSEVAY